MIIIVTGPDKTGKSSISSFLRHYFNAVVIKGSVRKREAIPVVTESYIETFERNPDQNFLCDRFHIIDERVYSPAIADRRPIFSREQIQEYENRLRKLNTVVIRTDAQYHIIERRYEDLGGDEYTQLDDVNRVREFYDTVIEQTTLPVISIDSTHDSIKQNVCDAISGVELVMREEYDVQCHI